MLSGRAPEPWRIAVSELGSTQFRAWASLVGSVVKNLPASAGFDPWVREHLLEKEMATHSSILACRIPWTGEPGGLQPVGLQRVGHN